MQAEVEGRSVMVGNVRMFQSRGIQLGSLESEVARLQSEAKTAMLVAIDNQAAGIIAVADTIKDSSKEAIADMHKMGLKVVMITGDNQKTADAIAKQVGVDLVLAEVLPEGKANEVKKLQSKVEGQKSGDLRPLTFDSSHDICHNQHASLRASACPCLERQSLPVTFRRHARRHPNWRGQDTNPRNILRHG